MENLNFEGLLKESLKINVMSQIDTGNPYIDAVMRMIMLTMLTAITGKFIGFVTEWRTPSFNFNIARKIYLWWKQPKRILITGHIFRELRFLHIRFDFSQRFKAILHKILKSMSTEKNKKLIKKIKELLNDVERGVLIFLIEEYFKTTHDFRCVDELNSLTERNININPYSFIDFANTFDISNGV